MADEPPKPKSPKAKGTHGGARANSGPPSKVDKLMIDAEYAAEIAKAFDPSVSSTATFDIKDNMHRAADFYMRAFIASGYTNPHFLEKSLFWSEKLLPYDYAKLSTIEDKRSDTLNLDKSTIINFIRSAQEQAKEEAEDKAKAEIEETIKALGKNVRTDK